MTLLFSGGLDTTAETILLAEHFEELHLLTFDNGFCINVSSSRKNVTSLRETLKDNTIKHIIISTKEALRFLGENFRGDLKKYRSTLVIDHYCKMAAVTMMLMYNLEKGISVCSDGATSEQNQIFLQVPEFGKTIKHFLNGHGILFREAITFDWAREKKQRFLEKKGIFSGYSFLEIAEITPFLTTQPFCCIAFLTYFYTSRFRNLPFIKSHTLTVQQAIDFWREQVPRAERFLEENRKNLDHFIKFSD